MKERYIYNDSEYQSPMSLTIDDCVFTFTTRYGAMAYTNILRNPRFPMSAVIYEYK